MRSQEALRNLGAAFAHFYRRCQLTRAGKLNGMIGSLRLKTKKRGWAAFASPAAAWCSPTRSICRGWARPALAAAGWGGRGADAGRADLRLSRPSGARCGLVLDRDLNAALTLATLAGSSSVSQHAGGER